MRPKRWIIRSLSYLSHNYLYVWRLHTSLHRFNPLLENLLSFGGCQYRTLFTSVTVHVVKPEEHLTAMIGRGLIRLRVWDAVFPQSVQVWRRRGGQTPTHGTFRRTLSVRWWDCAHLCASTLSLCANQSGTPPEENFKCPTIYRWKWRPSFIILYGIYLLFG